MNTSILTVEGVTKRFAGNTAVDALSLDVPQGVIYGLLGPNGAGKSTTIRMIMNIYVPDAGSIRLFGESNRGRDLSPRIGYLPEERGLYQKMRVIDVLLFLAEVKGMDRRAARPKAIEWLERLGLGDRTMRKVNELSKGMQQKVQFISTVLHDPDLLVMDEPFSGLDPVNAQVMKDTVLDLRRRGKTILFSTHIMEQAEKLCDHVCIIARGRKLVDGTLGDLKRTHGGRHVVVGFDGASGDADRIFADSKLVAKHDGSAQYAELELATGADPQRILAALVTSGARLSRFEIAEPSLNKIFIDLVGPDAAVAAAQPEEVAHA
jgi:ABC-2 type transport system ATP-binding protein